MTSLVTHCNDDSQGLERKRNKYREIRPVSVCDGESDKAEKSKCTEVASPPRYRPKSTQNDKENEACKKKRTPPRA